MRSDNEEKKQTAGNKTPTEQRQTQTLTPRPKITPNQDTQTPES